LALVSTLLGAAPAQADQSLDHRTSTVLERVKQTGVLVAGTRVDAMPMAYRQADNQWVGYSVEMLEQIRQHVQQQVRRPVELQIVAIDSTNQMTKVMQGEVDLVCGSTSITQGRELDIHFSVGYFQTGTQLLFDTAGSLGLEFTIGVLQGTTNQQVVERLFPIAQIVPFASRPLGFAAVGGGQVDALASDGILLEGLRLSSPTPERFELFPDQPYDREIYGCMVPKEDPAFQQAVNTSLINFMQGVLAGDPVETAILNRWFGPTGVIPIDQQPLRNLFREQIDLYTQLQQRSSAPRPIP
jgi:polar amino acid transport system substrate-binding protein